MRKAEEIYHRRAREYVTGNGGILLIIPGIWLMLLIKERIISEKVLV
jgi:hypothetical protein